ncbi:MAG: Dabb family protein [Tannerella sp.]|jgi:heme-degrading monooxygenase HmoA|nr:Dabb family protein [Tannerella sp.]
MKRRHFIHTACTATLAGSAAGALAGCTASAALKSGEIMHTVIFDLKHPVDSPEARKFLDDGYRILTGVPGVRDFQAYRQCSPKNDFQYGFLMKFDDRAAFDAYTAHPLHNRFVRERWETEVTHFQESDFIAL